jgi:hypothetical protein
MVADDCFSFQMNRTRLLRGRSGYEPNRASKPALWPQDAFRNFHRVSEHVAYKRLNPGQVYNVSRPARSTKTPGLNVSLPELTVFGAI